MITLVEAKDFRCLRFVRQPLLSHQVLTGPGGSGKTSFLSIVPLMSAVAHHGCHAALRQLGCDLRNLTWRGDNKPLELAIEAAIPLPVRKRLPNSSFGTIRYEIALAEDELNTGEPILATERVLLKTSDETPARQIELFPLQSEARSTIMSLKWSTSARTVVHKVPLGNDNYYSETYSEPGKGWVVGYKLGKYRSALSSIPEDESRFPATLWFKRMLADSIHWMALEGRLLLKACPPGRSRTLMPTGENLAWVVRDLAEHDGERFQQWMQHLQRVIPEIDSIRAIERQDDRHCYLTLRYRNGMTLPSCVISESTMRLVAWTLLPYLPAPGGTYVVEEIEHGLDGDAAEAALRALFSIHGVQVVVTTHSSALARAAPSESVLCFSKGEDGATEIRPLSTDSIKET